MASGGRQPPIFTGDRGLTPPAHPDSQIANPEPTIADRGLTPPAHPAPQIANPEPTIADRGLTPPPRRVCCSTPRDLIDGLEWD
jgi:hypothetical protein